MAKTAASTAPKAASKAASPSGEQLFYVIDLNAQKPIVTGNVREHQGRSGRVYKIPGFISDAEIENGIYGCAMPPQDALAFLRDPSFEVFDSKGQKLEPQRPTLVSSGGGLKLKPHETVATYHELSRAALLRRVAVLEGGQAFNANTPSEALVEFLVSRGAPQHRKVEAGPRPTVSTQAPSHFEEETADTDAEGEPTDEDLEGVSDLVGDPTEEDLDLKV